MKIQLSSFSWTILESVKILAKHLLSCYFVHVCPGSNFLDIIVLERMIRATFKSGHHLFEHCQKIHPIKLSIVCKAKQSLALYEVIGS